MIDLRHDSNARLAAQVGRLVCAEFALLEACEAAAQADREIRVERIAQIGCAQVHIFDLESTLLKLGHAPVSYSRCVRHSMGFGRPSVARARERLLDGYERVLARPDLPAHLRELLAANLDEHARCAPALALAA